MNYVVPFVAILMALLNWLAWPALDSPEVDQVGAAVHPNPQAAPVTSEVASAGAPGDANSRERVDSDARPSRDLRSEPLAERVTRARERSGVGSLTGQELAALREVLAGLERGMADQRHGFVASGGSTRSLQFIDMTYDIEGAVAKANALVEGRYVLLPLGVVLGHEIAGDENVHIVVGPGGTRDGRAFATHFVIDLQEHGHFAVAKRDLERALREKRELREK